MNRYEPDPQVDIAYHDAVVGLNTYVTQRPDPDDFKGLDYANTVADWRVGLETVVGDILARAGY